jgi:hypothetical protein
MTARLIDDVKLKVDSSSNSKQTAAAGSEKSSKNIRQQHPIFSVLPTIYFSARSDKKLTKPIVNSS